jgi:hypothetical protein
MSERSLRAAADAERSATYAFVRDELGVAVRWLELGEQVCGVSVMMLLCVALAWRSRAQRRTTALVHHLLLAGEAEFWCAQCMPRCADVVHAQASGTRCTRRSCVT